MQAETITISSTLMDIHYNQVTAETVLLAPHSHGHFAEVMVVMSGSVVHKSQSSECTMARGDAAYLPVLSAHEIAKPSDDFVMVNYAFLSDMLPVMIGYLAPQFGFDRTAHIHLDDALMGYIEYNHERMLVTLSKENRGTILRASVCTILEQFAHVDLSPPRDWFHSMLSEMQKPQNFCQGLSRMRALSMCSNAYLSRVFMREMGITPTQHLEKLRISYACNLIRHSTYSIQEIAMECSYDNLSYFYRVFQKHTGVTPRQYRSRYLSATR